MTDVEDFARVLGAACNEPMVRFFETVDRRRRDAGLSEEDARLALCLSWGPTSPTSGRTGSTRVRGKSNAARQAE